MREFKIGDKVRLNLERLVIESEYTQYWVEENKDDILTVIDVNYDYDYCVCVRGKLGSEKLPMYFEPFELILVE